METFKSSTSEPEYVDIHGRSVRVEVSPKTGEILIPLSELKQTGFSLYRKSHYNKLLIDDKEFTKEFTLHMLEAATTYILNSKVAISEHEILQTIKNVKRHLIENASGVAEKTEFLKTRQVAENDEDNIQITKTVKPQIQQPTHHTHHQPQSTPHHSSTIRDAEPHKATAKPSTFNQTSPLTVQNVDGFNEERGSRIANGPKSPSETSYNSRMSDSRGFQKRTSGGGGFGGGGDNGYQRRSADNFSNNQRRSFDNNLGGNKNGPRRSFENNFQQDSRGSNEENQQRGFANGGGNLRMPRSPASQKIIDPMDKVDLTGEHTVIVVHIVRSNIIWVQDENNLDVLLDLTMNLQEEAAQNSSVPPLLHKVYMAMQDGLWYRCRVIGLDPLKVFFLDYGNTDEVSEVRPISHDLLKIPMQAVKITYKEHEYTPVEEDKIKISFKSKNNDDSLFVKVMKNGHSDSQQQLRNDFSQMSVNNQSTLRNEPQAKPPLPATPVTRPKEMGFFQMPSPIGTLQPDKMVIVIGEENGQFYLRTKECYDKLKEINQQICTLTAAPLDVVAQNQLILAPNPDSTGPVLNRAVVLNVASGLAKVKFLDYPKTQEVALQSVKAITEKLCSLPITFYESPTLKGYTKPLGEEARKYLAEAIKNEVKFLTIFSGGFDLKLKSNNSLLSTILSQMDAPSKPQNTGDRVMLNNMERVKAKFETAAFMCCTFESMDSITIIPYTDELMTNMENVIVNVGSLDDNTPYEPIVNEVCFGSYEDAWYRCVIDKIDKDKYDVVFIDFGNKATLTSQTIRKLTPEQKKIPILGLRSRFVGIARDKATEDALRHFIEDGEIYQATVQAFKDGVYDIELPEVYQSIKQMM